MDPRLRALSPLICLLLDLFVLLCVLGLLMRVIQFIIKG